MVHHTKTKGDLAVALTIADLAKKGYNILLPAITEHLPFDLVAYDLEKFYRIQCKYSKSKIAANNTVWADKHGNHIKKYGDNDFDYYAIYLPDIDQIIYPSIKFGGCQFSTTIPNSPTPFHWYEDFLNFTDEATKKTYKDFGISVTRNFTFTDSCRASRLKARKVIRPTKEELEKLVWEKPTVQLAKDFGVSDKAIEKWTKSYKITKPPRGYWAKLKYNKL